MLSRNRNSQLESQLQVARSENMGACGSMSGFFANLSYTIWDQERNLQSSPNGKDWE